jgi:hypothetical protein
MNFGSPAFVITIIALCMAGWVITTYIRARHGYPLSDDWGNPVHPIKQDDEATRALAAENEQLKATVGKLEERLKVLERIATDPAERVSREIDDLR